MNQKAVSLSFDPKELNKRLFDVLPKRARDILSARFGLSKNTKKMTLESIGKKYGITRERIRQIESYSLNILRKADVYQKEKPLFDELKEVMRSIGSIVKESDFLDEISDNKSVQNHVHFMLTISEYFNKQKEDEEFHHRWFIDHNIAEKIHGAIRKLYSNLSDDQIVPESEIIKLFLNHITEISDEYKDGEIIRRWLSVSKKVGKNPLGEWGKTSSSNIRAKGVRDYAYLIIRKHGSPIHFKEVAELIEKVFKKRAHVATTHNELIKDERFVLVGRGLYALSEWGYQRGVVKDVIKNILEKEGPLPKEKIVEKVMKERYVKENTVIVNLQNSKLFKKDKNEKYRLIS